MKGINKIALVGTKIIEVFHWVGAVLMAAATVCSQLNPEWVKYFVGLDTHTYPFVELNVYGFEIVAPVTNGMIPMKALLLFGIGAVIILGFMAMVFRNMHLIIKKSEGGSPFQKDNIRMLREIGIFTISIPIYGLFMSILCRLILGADAVETSMNLYGFFTGIIVLCLTQVFIYGAKLEKDVDGLL